MYKEHPCIKLCFSVVVIQGDQLCMAVFIWYLVKRDCPVSRVLCCTVAYTSVTFSKVPEQHGHVYLVGLYFPKRICHLRRVPRWNLSPKPRRQEFYGLTLAVVQLNSYTTHNHYSIMELSFRKH